MTVEIDKRRRASLPAEGVYAPVQGLVVTCEVLLARARRNELERRGEDTGTRTQAAPLLVRLTQDRCIELDRGSRVRALPRGHHARHEFRECCACCGARRAGNSIRLRFGPIIHPRCSKHCCGAEQEGRGDVEVEEGDGGEEGEDDGEGGGEAFEDVV